MIRWKICQQDFKFDGAWFDIYVFEITIKDWQSLFNVLQTSYEFSYSIDGELQQLPKQIKEVFLVRKSADPALSFPVGKILVNCHFFSENEIEFDIDPREVNSQIDLDALLIFLQQVGNAVHRPVILTPENGPKHPIISYEPELGRLQYHDAKSNFTSPVPPPADTP